MTSNSNPFSEFEFVIPINSLLHAFVSLIGNNSNTSYALRQFYLVSLVTRVKMLYFPSDNNKNNNTFGYRNIIFTGNNKCLSCSRKWSVRLNPSPVYLYSKMDWEIFLVGK